MIPVVNLDVARAAVERVLSPPVTGPLVFVGGVTAPLTFTVSPVSPDAKVLLGANDRRLAFALDVLRAAVDPEAFVDDDALPDGLLPAPTFITSSILRALFVTALLEQFPGTPIECHSRRSRA